MKIFVPLIFALSAFSFAAFAQDNSLPVNDCSTSQMRVGFDNRKCFKPVIFGDEKDGFPNKMEIKGLVTNVTLVQLSCGVLCHFGTAEIKLSEKPKGFKNDFIYVTVLCFSGKKEEYLNRTIEQKVIKTDKKRSEKYYCGSIYNFIDSNGLPFYDLLDDKNKISGRLMFTEAKAARSL